MKKSQAFQNISLAELQSRVVEFKKELLKLNTEVAAGANPASPGKMKQTKKNIARILTLLREREER